MDFPPGCRIQHYQGELSSQQKLCCPKKSINIEKQAGAVDLEVFPQGQTPASRIFSSWSVGPGVSLRDELGGRRSWEEGGSGRKEEQVAARAAGQGKVWRRAAPS